MRARELADDPCGDGAYGVPGQAQRGGAQLGADEVERRRQELAHSHLTGSDELRDGVVHDLRAGRGVGHRTVRGAEIDTDDVRVHPA